MENSQAREAILSRIQRALRISVPKPFTDHSEREVYIESDQPILETFSAEFTALQGHLVLCQNKADVLAGLSNLVQNREWGDLYCQTPELFQAYDFNMAPYVTEKNPDGNNPAITDCEVLIARTGTIVLTSAQASGRALPVHTPIHIVIASVSQLVYDIKDAIGSITAKYGANLPSALLFTSGPSRTGDIEKTLVMGVHGPVEVHVFLRTDQ